jgi:pimeloyl-ACP methyl ester carboxylesterase
MEVRRMAASLGRLIGIAAATALVLGVDSYRRGPDIHAAASMRVQEGISMKGYARANDLEMYYEIHGEGEPLILLHGGFMTIDLNWGAILPQLSQGRRVIAVELQGHGHTADLDRPLSYEQMADDTAALLRALDIPSADVLGYSLGGTTAIEMAIRHPDLVRKLVVISAPYDRDGWYPEVYATLRQMTPEMFAGSGLPEAYAAVAPNPGGFPTLMAKVQALDAGFAGRTADEFRGIAAPTLIIVGDSDGVPLEKVVEMFKLRGGGVFGDVAGLPKSRLAVLPGTTHAGIMQHADLLLPMITAFLGAR